MKIGKLLLFGFVVLIFVSGCEKADQQNQQQKPSKETLEATPPLPPK